jgi:serine/threonine protein kinase
MPCSKCGTSIAEGARYCPICGAVTSSVTPMAAAPAATNDSRAALSAASRAPEANKPNLLVAQTIDGKYRLDEMLGAGGMGTVYQATRLLIGDTVAVKLLHPQQVADTQAVERFRREAQAAARLKHHNAVTIYDFGVSDDGVVYLVMELVEGRSLRDIIKQQGPLTPTAAAEIFTQACAALDEAHRQNIIHRDVKPDNIMINTTPNGLRVKVLDFGIAKLRDLATTASSLTQTGSVVGTPHYMSPEQCMGEELDHRSDIYSLGVVLYEALTGILPFNSPTSAAIVVQQVTQPPPPLRSINMSVSPAVEAVVLRALEKPRNARPQTAGAMAQELSAAVQSGTVGPPETRANVNAATPRPVTAVAPGLAPTMQMSIPKSSGSVTPVSIPPTGVGERITPWPIPAASTKSAAAKRRLPIVIGVVAVAAVAVAAFVYFGLGSPKRNILSEIKKGNLVKPEGSSAYDLYLKHAKADLSPTDKTEITSEAVPELEKRGEEIITHLKQDASESEAEWAEGIRIYGWLNDLNPKSAYESRRFFSQARLAFLKKDYNKSIPDYLRSIDLDPAWVLPVNALGRAYYLTRDKTSARQYYTRATGVEPGWIIPWLNLSGLCLEERDPYTAQDAAQHAIAIDPQKASAHYFLAQAYEKMNRDCDAAAEYKLAVDNAFNASSAGSNFNIDNARSKAERLRIKGNCDYMGE